MKWQVGLVILGIPWLSAADQPAALLTWDTKQLRIEGTESDVQLRGEIKFRNLGTTPIAITDVKTDCPCMEATADKASYAPGESGVVSVVANVANYRGGVLKKKLLVRTDEPAAKPMVIPVCVSVPELATCEPPMLVWQANDARHAKDMTVTLGKPGLFKIRGATTSVKGVVANVSVLEEARQYRVTVTPGDAIEGWISIFLETDLQPSGLARRIEIYAQVAGSKVARD